MIKTLNFNNKRDPEILSIINRLAKLNNRKPHDMARCIILEAAGRLTAPMIADAGRGGKSEIGKD